MFIGIIHTMKMYFLKAFLLVSVLTISTSVSAASLCPSYGHSLVDISLTAPASTVFAGARLPVAITIKNVSDINLSGGSLLMRFMTTDASHLILRSVPIKDIQIKKGSTFNTTINLDIPSFVKKGTYIATISYVPYTGANLENPDIDFALKSGANNAQTVISVENTTTTAGVVFDQKTLKSSDETPDKPIVLAVDLVNTDTTQVSIPVVWKLYHTNATHEANLLGTLVDTVKVGASTKKMVSYTISDTNYPLYILVAEATSPTSNSIITKIIERPLGGARLYMSGANKVIDENKESIFVFGCVQNIFADDTDKRFVVVDILNKEGVELTSGEFEIASGNTFTFTKDISSLSPQDISLVSRVVSAEGVVKSSVKQDFLCDTYREDCNVLKKSGTGMPVDSIFNMVLFVTGMGGLLTLNLYVKRKRFISHNS